MEDLLKKLKEEYSGFGADAVLIARRRLKNLNESRNAFEKIGRRYPESDRKEEEALIYFLAEKAALKQASKNATDERYREPRQLLDKAASVAKLKWEGGSNLKHHQMKKYLIEEYQDEAGKYPFLNIADKSILETCKRVALEIKRPDLISGQKKSP